MKILYIGNNLTQKNNYTTTFSTLSNLFEKEGITVFRSSSIINKVLRMLDMIYAVIKNHSKIDFVLIDTYSTSNFYFALITSQLSRFYSLKYIPILHGGNLPNRLDRNPRLSNLIFKNAYANIAPSGYLKFEFEKRGYLTDFIPNVLNVSEYKFKNRETIQPKLLWVRAFSQIYNPEMAVNVLSKLIKNFPQAYLCMVGPDKEDGSLQSVQQLVQTLHLENQVHFTGVLPKEEWHKLSDNYDIFINTTTIDNTPVSVMEAMALGLPIISTQVGGIPYLVKDNFDGLLVQNNNVDDMVDKIQELLNKPELVNHLTTNARIKIEAFDWSVVRNKWLDLFQI